MENSTEEPQKMKNRTIMYDPAISLLGTYPKVTKTLTQKDYLCVYGSIIYNSQDMETTYMSTNG